MLLAVLFAVFRDDFRQHPWEVARDLVRNLVVVVPALLLARPARRLGNAGSARLAAWGATRAGRAGPIIARVGAALWWVALVSLLIGVGLVSGRWADWWLRGRGW